MLLTLLEFLFGITTKVSGTVADWRGLEGHRRWQLEGRGVERQELSRGDVPNFWFITPFRREFLTATRLERATHGLRCTALLGRAMPYENRHGNRCTELWRGPLTLHDDNHPREIPTALGREQSPLHTSMRQCPTFAYTIEAQRPRSRAAANQYFTLAKDIKRRSGESTCWAYFLI